MDQNDPVTVYTVHDAFEAQIIKNAMEAEGIACVLAGIEQASTAAIPGTAILVQVAAHDAEKARKFLEEHQKKPQ